MANTALKYYQNATYQLGVIRKEYKSFLDAVILPRNHSLSVMDIGCGSGRVFNEVLLPLLPKNVSEVIGSDIDEDMIEFCRSMNTQPRVSFEKLDIVEEVLPKHLDKRFDLLFTSFCFSYLRDWRQGLMNCRKLLKPNGELSFISQFKTNALNTTYRRMSSMDRWKSYTRDYSNYVAPLSGRDPDSEVKTLFKSGGLTIINHRFDNDYFLEVPKREVLNVYLALDRIRSTLPQDQQEAFAQEFSNILSEEAEIDFADEESLDDIIQFKFPTVYVHAKKLKN